MFEAGYQCVVVVGVQWGDEGKGKIVDALAEHAELVVRYQGGANAGHTVITDGEEFILHQIPSGILQPATMCVIGNGVVLDPETLLDEMDALEKRGVDLESRLRVSDRAHLVFPYHKLIEVATELRQQIGTTGRGIGPAYEDKTGRRGVRVGDLRDVTRAEEAVRGQVRRSNKVLEMLESPDRASEEEHVKLLRKLFDRIDPLVCDTGLLTFRAIQDGKHVLLEGAQGALLDVDHGTYPFVTSSNTTAGAAAVGAGIGPTVIDAVLGVAKAYTTRVGNGPLPTEECNELGDKLRELGGEFGATTGRPRRCGWFDAAVARYSARVNGLTHLAVTKLDVLDTLAEIRICTGYRVAGELLADLPADSALLGRVEPVYEVHRGWQSPTGDVADTDSLPGEARSYLTRLEELVGVRIRYVSVGNRRDQLVAV